MSTFVFPKALIGAFGAVAALAAAGSAAAQEQPRQVMVRYGDLNLTTASGEAELTSRVRRAAGQVCAAHGTRDLKSQQMANACAAETIANAQPNLQLAINAARSGQQLAQNTLAVSAGH